MPEEITLNTLLTVCKSMCNLLLSSTIEASTPKIKKNFESTLRDYLSLQEKLFSYMEEQGMYKLEQVPENKITKTLNKYSK